MADGVQRGSSSVQAALACLALVRQQGKNKRHTRSLSWLALGLDASAVGFGYGLRYGEAEAAAGLFDSGQSVEAVEEVGEFRLRYAWTLILDVDAQLPVGGGGPEGHALSLRAVLHRVVHEGQDRLLDPHGIHPYETVLFERSR